MEHLPESLRVTAKSQLILSHRVESHFVFLTCVRPLFYLKEFHIFNRLKTVAAGCKQNDIARIQNSTFNIGLISIIEINSEAARSDN